MEKINFSTFKTCCFYGLERSFIVLEYRKMHHPGLYYIKKSLKNGYFFDQNDGLTLLGKCQFFDFFNLMFLYSRKAFFRSRILQKTFSWPIMPKTKPGKMAVFGAKPWVNPFGKMSIFRLFKFLVFIAKKRVFSL